MKNNSNKIIFSFSLALLLSVISFAFTSGIQQGFHVSTTKVDFDAANKRLKVACKLNTEDIESVVGKRSYDIAFKSIVSSYISKNLRVAVNGMPRNMRFVGLKPSPKAVYVYFEVSGVSSLNSLSIQNSLLISKFRDQNNVVNITVGAFRKMLRFDFSRRNQTIPIP